jgi:hypothetical protein
MASLGAIYKTKKGHDTFCVDQGMNSPGKKKRGQQQTSWLPLVSRRNNLHAGKTDSSGWVCAAKKTEEISPAFFAE